MGGEGLTEASRREPDLKKSSQPSHSLSTAKERTSPCAQGAMYSPLERKLTKERYWYLPVAALSLSSTALQLVSDLVRHILGASGT